LLCEPYVKGRAYLAAIQDAENDVIARHSEKFESQTEPLSPPSAAPRDACSPEQPMMVRIAMIRALHRHKRKLAPCWI